MLNNVVIEEINKNQIKNFYNFKKEILSETKFLITSKDELMDFDSFRNYVLFYITNPYRIIYIAKFKEKIIGEITMMIHEKKKMKHVAEFGISVLKEFRGIGIGKKLISTAEQWAFEHGVKRIQLEVMSNNLKAINLYLNLGYKIEGRKKMAVSFDNHYVDLLIMGKIKE